MNKDPNFVKLVAPVKLISSYLRDFLIEQTFLRPSDLMTILQVHMKLSEANKSEMSIKICMDLATSIHGVFIVTHEAYIICFHVIDESLHANRRFIYTTNCIVADSK